MTIDEVSLFSGNSFKQVVAKQKPKSLIYAFAPAGTVRTSSFSWQGYTATSNCMYTGDKGYYVAGAFMDGYPADWQSPDIWATTVQGSTSTGYIQLQLDVPKVCSRIAMTNRHGKGPSSQLMYFPRKFQVLGSDDGVQFNLLYEHAFPSMPACESDDGFVAFDFDNARKHLYYRLQCTGVWQDRLCLGRIRMCG